MNKTEYMTELGQRLGPLPLSREDVSDALRFYEEYFAEAGPDREQDVIAELGSPAYVAAQIALKLSSSPTPLTEEVRSHASMLRTILIGIAAAPVALPLILAAGLVFLSLVIAAAAFVFAFGFSGVVCMITGAVVAVYSFTLLFSDFATGIYFLGGGLFALGIGGLLTQFGIWLSRICYKGAASVGTRFFKMKKGK